LRDSFAATNLDKGDRMEWAAAAGLGVLGGVLPDLIKAIRKRFRKRPNYLATAWYWSMLVLLGLLGGAVAAFRHPHDAIEALAYGAAAPAFLTQIFAADDADHLGGDGQNRNLIHRMRRWWGS
jgi:hypothetical protein